MKLAEGDIEIEFTDALDAIVFDDMENSSSPNYHGVAHMHRVDFVVELETHILFIELKDPGNPRATQQGLQRFMDKLSDGQLGSSFASKFIDSFIYRWCEQKAHKPIHYVNLVTLDDAQNLTLCDEIETKLPPFGLTLPRWTRSLVNGCHVLNLDTWNDLFGSKWPASRISNQQSSV